MLSAAGVVAQALTPLPEAAALDGAVAESLKSLRYDREANHLQILDQLLIPAETKYVDVCGVEDGFSVIKKMQVRGAPLIASVATLALAVELDRPEAALELPALEAFVRERCAFLLSSRPTAVNLANALDVVLAFRASSADEYRIGLKELVFALWVAEKEENRRLLHCATACVLANFPEHKKLRVMTVCNTGSLATSSLGTALGVIRQLHAAGRLEMAFALETRPYNQGVRLTTYELVHDAIPVTLITDNMAAAAMRLQSIDIVLVGADQVALNGDTANKIGTYMLAVLAAYHRIPFFVVTPSSSINRNRADGSTITIEERPAAEMTTFNGKSLAPEGVGVWNPAFDVTPALLITGILTELGNFAPANLASGLASSF
ncbi:hypothetical protein QR680_012680 [Steinernema hermaphroditum]|uniref:Methylthioribose-1-phosphate isomerase n=1 Tax=Steinernema hermaphroditum TaxID=289476 RepID=A0AA39M154_9BILA|nr:hypothetical protein QR680_012680 [Steinernema hermaphroditum]